MREGKKSNPLAKDPKDKEEDVDKIAETSNSITD
jgi:hypothetical protein